MASSLKSLIEAQAKAQETRPNHSPDQHFPPADRAHLARKYGVYADGYAEEIEHIDHMLDAAHPEWNSTVRQRRSWGDLPPEVRDAVKWLINRRHLIMIGAGRDGLVLVARGDKRPPHAHRVPWSAKAYRSNPAAFDRCLSIPKLAADTGLSLREAKAIVGTMPNGYRYCVAEYVLGALAKQADETPVVDEPLIGGEE